MTRDEIIAVASKKYENDEFRTPNMYCFIEGAEYMQKQPLDKKLTDDERNFIFMEYATAMKDTKSISKTKSAAAYEKISLLRSIFTPQMFDNAEEKIVTTL